MRLSEERTIVNDYYQYFNLLLKTFNTCYKSLTDEATLVRFNLKYKSSKELRLRDLFNRKFASNFSNLVIQIPARFSNGPTSIITCVIGDIVVTQYI